MGRGEISREDQVQIYFPAEIHLEYSDDPVLDSILKECVLEADVRIGCEHHESEGFVLGHVDLERFSFWHQDPAESIKAKFLADESLAETIRLELTKEIEKNWDKYEQIAWEWEQGEIEDAMERMFEFNRDR